MAHDLDYYKKKLLWEKQDVLKRIDNFNDRGYEGLASSLRNSTGELSSYDNHPADLASDTFDRAKDIGLKDNAKLILQMIDDALEKIESGEYGKCDCCHKEIDSQRLEAMPYSTFCYECKAKSELRIGTSPHNSRPIEESVIESLHDGNIFAIKDKNQDYNGYDGEDTWQDLERYGTSSTPSDIEGMMNYSDIYIDQVEFQDMMPWDEGSLDENFKRIEEEVDAELERERSGSKSRD